MCCYLSHCFTSAHSLCCMTIKKVTSEIIAESLETYGTISYAYDTDMVNVKTLFSNFITSIRLITYQKQKKKTDSAKICTGFPEEKLLELT